MRFLPLLQRLLFSVFPAPYIQDSVDGSGSDLLAGPSPSVPVLDTVTDTQDSQSDIATVAPIGLLALIVSPASSSLKKRKHSPSKLCLLLRPSLSAPHLEWHCQPTRVPQPTSTLLP